MKNQKVEDVKFIWHKYPEVPLDPELSEDDWIFVAYDDGHRKYVMLEKVGEATYQVVGEEDNLVLDAHAYAWAYKNIPNPKF